MGARLWLNCKFLREWGQKRVFQQKLAGNPLKMQRRYTKIKVKIIEYLNIQDNFHQEKMVD